MTDKKTAYLSQLLQIEVQTYGKRSIERSTLKRKIKMVSRTELHKLPDCIMLSTLTMRTVKKGSPKIGESGQDRRDYFLLST